MLSRTSTTHKYFNKHKYKVFTCPDPVQMVDSLQEVGRGYVICFVFGPGILETLLQHCVTAICVPVQVFRISVAPLFLVWGSTCIYRHLSIVLKHIVIDSYFLSIFILFLRCLSYFLVYFDFIFMLLFFFVYN
jgi:hypothetical protein